MARTIGVLVFPEFQLLDAAGPIAAFELAGEPTGGGSAPPPYCLRLYARDGGAVVSSSGAALTAEPFAAAAHIDTLMVAGGRGVEAALRCARTLAFVRAAGTAARRVASVCTGAFLLAAAGLLDERRATTHWRFAADLARRYPRLRVEPDHIFVRDGTVWSSAGITAGIDLALALIGDDLGDEAAKRVARQLVVYHRRPGGQSQFSALLELDRPDGRFGALLAWAREHLAEPLPVERLAAQAAMSPRHFARAFVAETGATPARAIEHLRLEMARARIEGRGEAIERIAAATGFRDPERMRRAFIRAFGQPPQALRRAARG
jgi:transcriptional regulator GlxA family with amidase domain